MTRRFLPWAALLAALSPVLLEMIEHARAFPWAGVWPLFLALFFALESRSVDDVDARPSSHRLLGRIGLVLTAITVVVFVGGREPRLARLAVPLGFISMATLLGRPALRPALLAIWMVPLPTLLPDLLHPQLTNLWLRLTETLVESVQLVPSPRRLGDPGLGLRGSGSSFPVHEGFNGIALTWALGGLGLFHMLRVDPGASFARLARSGVLCGAWGLPAQGLVFVACGIALAHSQSLALAQLVLGWGWIGPVGLALAIGLRSRA